MRVILESRRLSNFIIGHIHFSLPVPDWCERIRYSIIYIDGCYMRHDHDDEMSEYIFDTFCGLRFMY